MAENNLWNQFKGVFSKTKGARPPIYGNRQLDSDFEPGVLAGSGGTDFDLATGRSAPETSFLSNLGSNVSEGASNIWDWGKNNISNPFAPNVEPGVKPGITGQKTGPSGWQNFGAFAQGVGSLGSLGLGYQGLQQAKGESALARADYEADREVNMGLLRDDFVRQESQRLRESGVSAADADIEANRLATARLPDTTATT